MTPDDHPDKQAIVDAQSAVQAVAKHVNESKRAHEARKYVKVLHPTGKDLNHTKRRRMAEIQKMSVMGDKVEERLYGTSFINYKLHLPANHAPLVIFLSETIFFFCALGCQMEAPVRDHDHRAQKRKKCVASLLVQKQVVEGLPFEILLL